MATSPATDQSTYGTDVNDVCKGVKNIYIDGSPVGILKAGENIPVRYTAGSDTDIMDARSDGSILGKRQAGRVYELDFSTASFKLENLRHALDPQGGVTGDWIAVGESNKVASLHEVVLEAEAPNQRTRRTTFFKCVVELNGDILWATSGTEVSAIPMKVRVCKDLSRVNAQCYFEVYDYD